MIPLIQSKTMAFDGNVGDLGSKTGPSLTTFEYSVKGTGDKKAFLDYVHRNLIGATILAETLTDSADESFTYTAQVQSSKGIL